jgi:hypothetical protein
MLQGMDVNFFIHLEQEELAISFHDQVLLAHRCNARVDFGISELLRWQKILVDDFFRTSKLHRLKNSNFLGKNKFSYLISLRIKRFVQSLLELLSSSIRNWLDWRLQNGVCN